MSCLYASRTFSQLDTVPTTAPPDMRMALLVSVLFQRYSALLAFHSAQKTSPICTIVVHNDGTLEDEAMEGNDDLKTIGETISAVTPLLESNPEGQEQGNGYN